MIKTLIVSTAFVVMASPFAFAAGLTDVQGRPTPSTPSDVSTQGPTHGVGVAADGRCGGVSYGTGERNCGTATGGPAGGLNNRN